VLDYKSLDWISQNVSRKANDNLGLELGENTSKTLRKMKGWGGTVQADDSATTLRETCNIYRRDLLLIMRDSVSAKSLPTLPVSDSDLILSSLGCALRTKT